MRKARRTRLIPEERVQLILEHALDLFARKPYASVTTRDIAAACGVNVALIYYYFGNKDGLLHAVIQRAVDQAYETYRDRTRHVTSPVQALIEWFQVNLDQFTQLKKMAQIWVSYNSTGPETSKVDSLIRRIYARELRLLVTCIRTGVESGDFKRVDPKRAATFISNYLDGLCFVSLTRPKTDMGPLMRLARETVLEYLLPSS